MVKFDKKSIMGVTVFVAVVAVGLYLLFPLGLVKYFTDKQLLLDFIREHRTNAVFIFIGLQTLQVVAAPVPGEVTGFVGGMLFGTVRGVVYSTAGLTLGSWLAFVLARMAGRPFVERVVNPETIKRYDYVMKHKGLFLAFLLFLIPGFPKDYLCYLLGLGHMRQRDFLLVSTSGRMLGTVLLTVEGSFFRDRLYVAFFTVLGLSIAAILIVMVYRETIERWFRKIRAAQLMKHRADSERLRKSK